MKTPTSYTTATHSKRNLYVLTGLIQGVACYLAITCWPKGNLWGSALTLAGVVGIVVGCLTLQFTGRKSQLSWRIAAAALMGGIFALPAAWCVIQSPADDIPYNQWQSVLTASAVSSSLVLLSILLPFVQAWPNREHGHFRYPDLFKHSWDNFFILLVAAMLAAAYWLLIVLWAMLFKMVGIPLFKTVFFTLPYASITLPLVFSLGIHIGFSHDQVIGTLRQITLSLCTLLMPLVALITILFALSLPFTGLQPIWDTGYSTPILLCLVGANILVFNGIFQDGQQKSPYPPLLRKGIEATMLLLPFFSAIGVYSTALRISQYGLTPHRIYLAVLLVVGCSYSLSYGFAVLKHSSVRMGAIRPANTVIALMICLFILLLHSPLFNPAAISVRNQMHRLLSGKVQPEKFDFGALKFQLGKNGMNALNRLNALPENDTLRKKITAELVRVNTAQGYYDWNESRTRKATTPSPRFTMLGSDTVTLDGLEDILPEEQCRLSPCYVYPIDLNNDTIKELILIEQPPMYSPLCLYGRNTENNWEKQGTLGAEMSADKQAEIVKLLKKSSPRAAAPRYQSVQIGKTIYHFQDLFLTEDSH